MGVNGASSGGLRRLALAAQSSHDKAKARNEMSVTQADILKVLEGVKAPSGESLPRANVLSPIVVNEGKAFFSLNVDADQVKAWEPVRMQAEAAVKVLPGIVSVMVALTAERKAGEHKAAAAAAPAASAQTPKAAHAPHGSPFAKQAPISGITHIIAVASGKGGVGKSTTSINIALGLAALGLKVGLMDADIYGPSVPRLTGIAQRPVMKDGKTIVPIQKYGLSIMSIGFVVPEESAMVWRGPMVMSAITQMLRDVAWGELDVLVVDMPPGTGDAQLTLAQAVPLSGAVIVSTPQDLALIDARRGLAMFNKVDVPVLGIVENMSYFQCPHCGTRSDIFGHGGARYEAEKLQVPFLGEVPLHMKIRELSDAGTPVVVSEPDSPHSDIYRGIARQVATQLHLVT